MDPKVLAEWLKDNGATGAFAVPADDLAELLCDNFVLRRRWPEPDVEPYRHKWS